MNYKVRINDAPENEGGGGTGEGTGTGAGTGAGTGTGTGAAAAGTGTGAPGAGATGTGAGTGTGTGTGTGAGTGAGAGEGTGTGAGTGAATSWPTTWREDIAAGDEKLLDRVKRYGSPRALAEALVAAQTKISSGQLAPELPANATAEQITEYRKQIGVPETADKYDTTLPDGLVIGANDKPIVDQVLKEMHAQHATPTMVKTALTAFFKIQQGQQLAWSQKIGAAKVATMEALQKEYGPQLKNLTSEVDNQGKALPNDLHTKMSNSVMPDGTRLGDNVDYIRWRIADALEKNPMATVLPGQTGAVAEAGLREEQAKLVKLSGDTKSAYWKGPTAKTMQQRLLDINDALSKGKG